MGTFEYVKHATKKEVDTFFNDLAEERKKDYSKNLKILNKFQDEIVNEYFSIKDDYVKNLKVYNQEVKDHKIKVAELIKNQTCECGSKLRLITGGTFGDFWGCSNYLNSTLDHKNYMNRPYDNGYFPSPSVRMWAAQIRERLGLSRGLRTAHIYNFILGMGLEDISLTYHGVSEVGNIYKLVDTRKKATEFEIMQYEGLNYELEKCTWQMAIKYKIMGVRGQHYAFPDIVGSDAENVYIYECKTSTRDTNEYQKQLYIDLITKMLRDAGNTKNVVFQYVFENN